MLSISDFELLATPVAKLMVGKKPFELKISTKVETALLSWYNKLMLKSPNRWFVPYLLVCINNNFGYINLNQNLIYMLYFYVYK